MILFHEGLPRSGKSYEAMVRHIAPALAKGRHVWAYIEGIDHAKVAQATELPEQQVRELLHQLTREQVPEFHKHVTRNSLIVLDEAQNFWPNGRQKLDAPTTQAITEHGHLGQDILLMGQDMRDVHALWRRRVSQRVVFNKMDAVGLEKRYSVVVHKATAPEKFAKVSSTTAKYDERWFGSYASHVDEDVQTGNYKDPRADVRNAFWFRWGLPIAFGVFAASGYYMWGFFTQKPAAPPTAVKATVQGTTPGAVVHAVATKPVKAFADTLSAQYRPRLALHYERNGREVGIIEWYDGYEVRERLSFDQLRRMGTEVVAVGGVARVGEAWATPWPVPARVEHQAPDLKLPSALQ